MSNDRLRILLINPWSDGELPPPSIGYLQATARQQGVHVEACNFEEAMLKADDYDIVGATFHSFSVMYARQIRDHFKGKLICGGHHASAMPEQMLSIGYDQVVIGEGENALIDIINGDTERIKRPSTKTYKTIDEYPIPDYTGLNYSNVLGVIIITSRGCPFTCSFCASTSFWGHSYRMRSADSVLSEIELRKSEGHKSWTFDDDNFTANRKRTFDICSALDGSYIWRCTSRAEVLDRDLCHEMYRAGCRVVWLGIESLSQSALDRMGKNTSVERMIAGINNCVAAGIEPVCLFLVGLPGDTRADVLKTRENISRTRIANRGVNIAWVLPGTYIYQKAKEYGMSDDIYLESGAPFYTYEQSMETLSEWSRIIMT